MEQRRNSNLGTLNHTARRTELRELIAARWIDFQEKQNRKKMWMSLILHQIAIKQAGAETRRRKLEAVWFTKILWTAIKMKINLTIRMKRKGATTFERARRNLRGALV